MTPIEVARAAATTAGDILQDYFHSGVQMRTKSASVDLVSDADINAERAIADVIASAFPEHSILGEEEKSDDVSATHLWIVDPLDGTTNFAHGVPHFAVSIGYYVSGVATVGVIYNPISGDWYTAETGKGAWHNGNSMQVSDDQELSTSLLGTGFFYDRGDMMRATLAAIDRLFQQQIHGIRRMGTASLDLAMVASGQLAGFFEYQLCPWDFAAGRLLIEEAGGRVSTCTGDVPPLDKTSFCATNGRVHDEMLRHVRLPG